jgi:carboxylate-amine ligase
LKSYRSVIFEMVPRSGIAPRFESYSEYESYLATLERVGTIGKDHTGKADATRIWWDVRPNPKFGTIEIRVPDLCTRIDEAVCIVAVAQH